MVTSNSEMLGHLSETQRLAVEAADGVQEYVRNAAKYKATEATKLINNVKALHPGCAICAAWDGSA